MPKAERYDHAKTASLGLKKPNKAASRFRGNSGIHGPGAPGPLAPGPRALGPRPEARAPEGVTRAPRV